MKARPNPTIFVLIYTSGTDRILGKPGFIITIPERGQWKQIKVALKALVADLFGPGTRWNVDGDPDPDDARGASLRRTKSFLRYDWNGTSFVRVEP